MWEGQSESENKTPIFNFSAYVRKEKAEGGMKDVTQTCGRWLRLLLPGDDVEEAQTWQL